MRHFLALPLLASRVRESPVTTRLVLPPRVLQRLCPRRFTTVGRAVPIAAVASRADEEALLTFKPATDNKSKRVQVPEVPTPENWTPPRGRVTTPSSDTSPWIDTRDSEVRTPSPSLSETRSPFAIPTRSTPPIILPHDLGDPGNPFPNHGCLKRSSRQK